MKWVCALDRNHYESSLRLMLRDLSLLEDRHPGLYIEFSENKRFVGQKSQNPFSRIPIDQCNEHQVNWKTVATLLLQEQILMERG